jgi:hypothetical protein
LKVADSVTESDSGEDVLWSAHVIKTGPPEKPLRPTTDSETESDPEYDLVVGSVRALVTLLNTQCFMLLLGP